MSFLPYLVNVYHSYKFFNVNPGKLEGNITDKYIFTSQYDFPSVVTSFEKIQPRNATVISQHGAHGSFEYGCVLRLVTVLADAAMGAVVNTSN